MEKDYCEEIRRRLSDVPAGRCLAIRCPLGRNETVRTFEDQRLPSDTRLKTITYELYPGI